MPDRKLTDIMTKVKNLEKGKGRLHSCKTARTISLETSTKSNLWLLYQTIRWLRRNTKQAFFVRSAETGICPCCEGSLKVSGSRRRVWYRSSGNKEKLIIRRLRCEPCEKIHHELPDVLVPYKWYGAESIEQVVSDSEPVEVAADESTLYRWCEWFKVWAPYAVGCLTSIAMRFPSDLPVGDMSGPPRTVLQRIGRQGSLTGWLANIVRPIVNVHLWVQTRSAFLSGMV